MRNKILLLLIIPFFCFSQKKEGKPLIDSLLVELPKAKVDSVKVFILNRLAFQFKNLNGNLCLKYANEALKISKKNNYRNGILSAYNNLAIYYTIKADYSKAKYYYNSQLLNTTEKKRISSVYTNLAVLYMYQSNYSKAIEYDMMSLKIDEAQKDLQAQAITLGNIGDIYFEIHDIQKAIIYFNKSLKIYKRLFLKDGITTMLFNIGQCNIELKLYDSALVNFAEAIKIDKEINNDINKAACLDGICDIYLQKKQYYDCISKGTEAIQLNLTIDNQSGLSSNYSNIGNAYKKLALQKDGTLEKNKFLNLANINFTKALAIEKNINDLKRISQINGDLYEIQKLQGNYKHALELYEISVNYKDSVFNSENKETIKNVEDKREIQIRDKELQLNKIKFEVQQKQKYLYISGIIFLIILGGLLFFQNRNRKKTNKKLKILNTQLDQANQIKTRFFGILNHDLRSPVANLIQFLNFQKDSPEILDDASKKRLENSTIEGAENLLSSMEDILLWSKGQMENFKPQPKNITIDQLFNDNKKVFSGYNNIKFEYLNPNNISIYTDANYLKTIIRNLTSNSINSFSSTTNPTIIWRAFTENNITFLTISDNGCGAKSEQFKAFYNDDEVIGIKNGLGLHLIRDLAKAINFKIIVDSNINEGTTIKLYTDLYKI